MTSVRRPQANPRYAAPPLRKARDEAAPLHAGANSSAGLPRHEGEPPYLVATPSEAVLITDEEGAFSYVCPGVEAVLGYSQDEIRGLGTVDALFPREVSALSSEEAPSGVSEFTTSIVDPQGQIRTITVASRRIPNDGSSLYICRDATDSGAAGDEHVPAPDRDRALIEGMSVGIAVFRPERGDFILTDLNRAAEEITGRDRTSVLGQSLSQAFPDFAQCGLPSMLKTAGESGRYVRDGLRLSDDGDSDGLLEAFVFGLPNGDTVAVFSDRAVRLRAEEALRKTEERLDLALRGANLGLWDWNITTGEAVLHPKALDLLEFPPHESKPHFRHFKESLHPDDRSAVMESLKEHMAGRTRFHDAEFRIRAKSGEWRWILSRGRVVELDTEGSPLRAVGTYLDITERKRAEEERQDLLNALETRVEERTAELRSTNELLKKEIAEHSRAQVELKRRDRLLESVAQGTRYLLTINDFEDAVELTLRSIGRAAEVDRTYVFENILHDASGERTMRRRFEWRSDSRASRSDSAGLEELPFSRGFERRHNTLGKGEPIRGITREFPPFERSALESQGIRSILVVPIMLQSCLWGCIGFDDCRSERRWDENDISILQAAAATVGAAIERKRAEEDLRAAHDDLEARVAMRTAELEKANTRLRREITERKAAEKLISESLAEKQVLLEEIHHRVKNNLQVISSMLSLQERKLSEPKSVSALADCRLRVWTMALIHEHLYRSGDLSRIDFTSYLRNLTGTLLRSYLNCGGAVRLNLDTEPISFGLRTAIPCGLIVHELVSNSLKHAFADGRRGNIHVRLTSAGGFDYELTVKDDGRGLPKDVDYRNPTSLGFTLVLRLVESQLNGRLSVRRDRGTSVRVKFTDREGMKRPNGA